VAQRERRNLCRSVSLRELEGQSAIGNPVRRREESIKALKEIM
jgi:hypothetical protein